MNNLGKASVVTFFLVGSLFIVMLKPYLHSVSSYGHFSQSTLE